MEIARRLSFSRRAKKIFYSTLRQPLFLSDVDKNDISQQVY